MADDIEAIFNIGEPTRVAHMSGQIIEWEMKSYGRTYRVVVAGAVPKDQWLVAVALSSDTTYSEPVHTWRLMKGPETGGVVTQDFVSRHFGVGHLDAENLAILIASALGRPYAVTVSADEAGEVTQ